jgi:hypothetical protein
MFEGIVEFKFGVGQPYMCAKLYNVYVYYGCPSQRCKGASQAPSEIEQGGRQNIKSIFSVLMRKESVSHLSVRIYQGPSGQLSLL